MKRIIRMIICAALCMGICAAASAESVPRCAAAYDVSVLEKYLGFTASNGEWRCEDGMMSALLDAVSAGEISGSLTKGQCFCSLTLAGNSRAGTLCPEITLYIFKKTPLSVSAVTFVVDGIAYDIQANVTRSAYGAAPCEVCRLPITEELLPLVKALSTADSARVIVMGAEGVYDITLTRDGSALEDASLRCFGLYDALVDMGAEGYALWDISAALWESDGLDVASRVSTDSKSTLVKPGDSGNTVTELQSLLSEAGFYAGKTETTAGDKTFAAVCRAQRFYSLPVSGTADSALIRLLKGEVVSVSEDNAAETVSLSLEGLEIEFSGWYSAEEALTVYGSTGLSAADKSNSLIICRAAYANNTAAQLSLSWDVSALINVDGAEFTASVRAIAGESTGYSTSVLPLASGDMLITAEVPAAAIENAGSITLTVTCDEASAQAELSR